MAYIKICCIFSLLCALSTTAIATGSRSANEICKSLMQAKSYLFYRTDQFVLVSPLQYICRNFNLFLLSICFCHLSTAINLSFFVLLFFVFFFFFFFATHFEAVLGGEGSVVTIYCSIPGGVDASSIVWSHQENRIIVDGSKYHTSSNRLRISNIISKDEGTYQCLFRTRHGGQQRLNAACLYVVGRLTNNTSHCGVIKL